MKAFKNETKKTETDKWFMRGIFTACEILVENHDQVTAASEITEASGYGNEYLRGECLSGVSGNAVRQKIEEEISRARKAEE